MASLYWRLAQQTGWTYPEIDVLPLGDFDEIATEWKEAAAVKDEDDMPALPDDAGPREISEEEWKRITAAEQGFAEKHGGPRNPFL